MVASKLGSIAANVWLSCGQRLPRGAPTIEEVREPAFLRRASTISP
jgi:hypothetical protein